MDGPWKELGVSGVVAEATGWQFAQAVFYANDRSDGVRWEYKQTDSQTHETDPQTDTDTQRNSSSVYFH